MMLFFIVWLAFSPDLTSVKAEPDLTKRCDLALTNAEQRIDAARQAFSSGDVTAMETALGEVRQSVELSYDSLHQSKENPRHSKFYKKTEQKILILLRRLNTLHDDVDLDYRPSVESVIQRLREMHDELLYDIMSKKKS